MGLKKESKVDYWLTDDGLILLESWSRDGITKDEIAHRTGVHRSMLQKWEKDYPEIKRALSQGKELIDYKVENALLKAALGYKTKEIKVTIGRKIFNGETVEMLKETTEREIAPNVQACLSWLNNRQFDKWKRNRDRSMELNEEDNNISITIVRGPKNDDLGENVNNEVKFETKGKEKEKTEPESVEDEVEEDIDDEWAGWEDEDEE